LSDNAAMIEAPRIPEAGAVDYSQQSRPVVPIADIRRGTMIAC
jgi:hypothetical protein